MKYVLTLLLLFVSIGAHAQLIHDESYLDPDFVTFRNQLGQAIQDKDTSLLKTLLADRILVSKDLCSPTGCTQNEFITYHFSSDNSSAYFWKKLATVFRFGFRRILAKNSNRIIPHKGWVFQGPSYLPTIDTDNETLILGENVNIRAKPSLKARVIRKASFEKFNCDCNVLTTKPSTFQKADGIGWLEIYLGNEQVGYVAAEYTSYLLYKELTVAKINGKWRIISFYNKPGC